MPLQDVYCSVRFGAWVLVLRCNLRFGAAAGCSARFGALGGAQSAAAADQCTMSVVARSSEPECWRHCRVQFDCRVLLQGASAGGRLR